MECPVTLGAEDIRNEKVKCVRSIKPIDVDDVVTGQYRGVTLPGGKGTLPGYLDDDTVPQGSITETFAAVACFISNARWDGVPFLLKAGKALEQRSAQIRVQVGTRARPSRLSGSKSGRWLYKADTYRRHGCMREKCARGEWIERAVSSER